MRRGRRSYSLVQRYMATKVCYSPTLCASSVNSIISAANRADRWSCMACRAAAGLRAAIAAIRTSCSLCGTAIDERLRALARTCTQSGFDRIRSKREKAVSKGLLRVHCAMSRCCPFYTSDAADDLPCVDLGVRRIIKKKQQTISYTEPLHKHNQTLT